MVFAQQRSSPVQVFWRYYLHGGGCGGEDDGGAENDGIGEDDGPSLIIDGSS